MNFWIEDRHIQKSTKCKNKRDAAEVERAYRTQLAKQEVGLDMPAEQKPAMLTLREFGPKFIAEMEVHCGGKPRTLKFWKEKLARLLEYEALASSPLDQIDKALIAKYIQTRHKIVAVATINRELATLRRLLRLAQEWNEISGVPRISMLKGERSREFVLNHQQEGLYLAAAPQPLRDVALLILDTGLRVGEALGLEWRDIQLEPAHGGRFGYLRVREGKSKNARRNVSLTVRVKDMLLNRSLDSKSSFVFAGPSRKPFVVTSLCHQNGRVRAVLQLPTEFVIHSLRHTMLTRLGEAGTDAFTIKRIAGHSSITISERYIHPTPEGLERAFDRLEAFNREASGSTRTEELSERV